MWFHLKHPHTDGHSLATLDKLFLHIPVKTKVYSFYVFNNLLDYFYNNSKVGKILLY